MEKQISLFGVELKEKVTITDSVEIHKSDAEAIKNWIDKAREDDKKAKEEWEKKKQKPVKKKGNGESLEELEAELQKSKARLIELENQDESQMNEALKYCAGKETNMPLVRNHIEFYEEKIAKLKGEKYLSRKRKEEIEEMKANGFDEKGYFINDYKVTAWTHYEKQEFFMKEVGGVVRYSTDDFGLTWGVILHDEQGKHTHTWMITKDLADYLKTTLKMVAEKSDENMPSWRVEGMIERVSRELGFREELSTNRVCPNCSGKLVQLKEKDSEHFAICDKCGNGYNLHYEPIKIYYENNENKKEAVQDTKTKGLEEYVEKPKSEPKTAEKPEIKPVELDMESQIKIKSDELKELLKKKYGFEVSIRVTKKE